MSFCEALRCRTASPWILLLLLFCLRWSLKSCTRDCMIEQPSLCSSRCPLIVVVSVSSSSSEIKRRQFAMIRNISITLISGSGRPGQGGQLTPPLKFGAEVRNCMWLLRRTGVKVMAMTTCLTISTISRGGVKINVSCYMIKLDF